jgi:hypothetical protein
MRSAISVAAIALLLGTSAYAEVTRVTITSRDIVAGGQSFGATGQYEKLSGTIEFSLDPADRHNAPIVDLAHAPREKDGRVHFTSDLYVIRPVDANRGNGVLFFEISNRGRKGLLGRFNRAGGSLDPTTAADFGDGFLMREGYTLVWVGWEFDVAPSLLRAHVPAALPGGRPLVAPLVVPFVVDKSATTATLTDAPRYPPADARSTTDTLTVRDRFWDRPVVVPHERWHFVEGTEGAPTLSLEGGFEPGRIYEVTYRANGAVVAGVGFAALRDAASAFRYRTDLPVRGRAAYVFGASQSGRYLRQFLHEGFNADEGDRRAFDAVWAHIAGAARGSFNERLAMPTNLSIFTATRFPFTDLAQQDAEGARGGILEGTRPDLRPNVFYTNTSVEYWGLGRGAALTHTTLDGRSDAQIPENVRIYLLAGTQHGEAAFPPTASNGQQLNNPTPQGDVMRALLRGLHRWVRDGAKPPDSRYPRLSDGTLTAASAVRFPALPGVGDPRTISGPGRLSGGTVKMFPFLVPEVDEDGNERAGIRVPEVAVPLATTTGWNFRAKSVGNPGNVYNLLGAYIPFPASRAEREARGDARRSIAERYPDRDDYLQRIKSATQELVRGGYLLDEDVAHVMDRATAHWQYATRNRATSSAQP